ncbi:unnamed protein product [Clonostachys rhizophaga]|uniref:Major facilitator superfamily (MFS) profile domain-containing protein n=1 Tax=Clonostachys rhizophaga TaxID=160324 RepID=A0A9N9VKT6_9HYPO|nr:unnamed protein product [Clonostachys rhizophaga]
MEFSDKVSSLPIQAVETGDHTSDTEHDWTDEEEKVLVRRVDFYVMPLLILGFLALQLDRGNIGNALTDDFLRDVDITQNQFNVGQQLLSMGIVLLEIPSNLVLYRLGPTIWIGTQVVAWGLVATFQAFQKGLGPYLATRLLLGLTEAGFIPAGLFTLSRWYKKDEISKRFAWFFLGNLLAAALSGIIAYGVLQMRGIGGLAGWQWLFLIEGIFTILVGIAFLTIFPTSIPKPVSLIGIRFFSERESHILTRRILADDPSKAEVKTHVIWQEVKNVFTNWRLLPHVALTICGLAPVSSLNSYAPTLVQGFGFGRLESNLLVSVGYWILLFVILLWGWASDKLRVRGPFVLLGLTLLFIFNVVNRCIITSQSAILRYVMLAATIAISWPWHPVNGSWLSLNAKTPGERSVTMAIHIMSANCAGIVGGQLFRSEDKPLYRNGWTVIVCLSAASVAFALVANAVYYLGNQRKLRRSGTRFSY